MNVHTWITSCSVGDPNVSSDALTSSGVVAHYAIGVGRTVTRVHTVLIAAGQHLGAVVVDDAFWPAADLVRVAQVARWTHAPGLVVAHFAPCVDAALLVVARVLAFALDACLGERAFKVALATG